MKVKYQAFILFSLILVACAPEVRESQNLSSSQPASPSSLPSEPQQPTKPSRRLGQAQKAEAVDVADLAALKWAIPPESAEISVTPPQPGEKITQINGKPIISKIDNQVIPEIEVTASGNDTIWTAFTLVLYRDKQGKYKALTQKRTFSPPGAIETAGGHLTLGETWRQGAATELEQEAGIIVDPSKLIWLTGGKPLLGTNAETKETYLWGNANFVILLKGNDEPKTVNNSFEVDADYGHQWIDLKTLYEDMKKDEADHKGDNGTYYKFFRSHVSHFCKKVFNCDQL